MSISGIECAFIARVGSNVDIRTSQAGKPWASFRCCVGDKNDDQTWLTVAICGDRANTLAVTKGDRIYCEGRIRLEAWQGKDGQERQTFIEADQSEKLYTRILSQQIGQDDAL